jgi:hypothetical protein
MRQIPNGSSLPKACLLRFKRTFCVGIFYDMGVAVIVQAFVFVA